MKQRNPLRQDERSPHNGILELPQLTPGLNVATLRCDGIRIGVVKLSIVK